MSVFKNSNSNIYGKNLVFVYIDEVAEKNIQSLACHKSIFVLNYFLCVMRPNENNKSYLTNFLIKWCIFDKFIIVFGKLREIAIYPSKIRYMTIYFIVLWSSMYFVQFGQNPPTLLFLFFYFYLFCICQCQNSFFFSSILVWIS